jgi:NDP-sugar pyrophosphorylase family protein
MMAVILAGGRGTRLKPLTVTVPKPLLPLGDESILEIVLAQLQAAGCRRVVITLGHMARLFAAVIGDGSRWGLTIDYVFEHEPLGTAGPLRHVHDLDDDFLVMNGDILTTLDFRALFAFHCSKRALGTIAVTQRTVQIDYGVITALPDAQLAHYHEKPQIHYAVSMGVNVLSKQCLAWVPADRKFDMPELMMAMHRSMPRVFCYATSCYWQDIGRMDDYDAACADYQQDPTRFRPARKAAERS